MTAQALWTKTPGEPADVFLSYAPADDKLAAELEKHLAQLERSGMLRGWSARKIGAGEEWRGKVHAQIERAQVILLLVSADFMASDYLNDVDVQRAMERHKAGTARVIPVILRAYRWEDAPFGRLTPLPTGGKPVTDTSAWPERDTAFKNIADGIVAALAELAGRRRAAPTSPQSISPRVRLARGALVGVLAVFIVSAVGLLLTRSSHNDPASIAPYRSLRACCRDTADATAACESVRAFAADRQIAPLRCHVCSQDEKQAIDPKMRWSMWLGEVQGPPNLLSGAVCARIGLSKIPEKNVCREFHRSTMLEPWRLWQARPLPVTVEEIAQGAVYFTLYAAGGQTPEGRPLKAAPGRVEVHDAGTPDDLYSTALCEGVRLHVQVVDDEGISHDDVTILVYLSKPGAL